MCELNSNDYGNYKVTARVSTIEISWRGIFIFPNIIVPDYNVTFTEEEK